ncbi:MAG: nucleotidyltransferase domain-containing protein [Polyangiales bacterium]
MSFDRYLEAHRSARVEERVQAELRRDDARSWAQRAAEALASFGVRRIVLYGSLARGTFGDRSDIDLSVEGLPEGKLFAASARANAGSPFEISLMRAEDAPRHVQAAIDTEGIELWRR